MKVSKGSINDINVEKKAVIVTCQCSETNCSCMSFQMHKFISMIAYGVYVHVAACVATNKIWHM